MMGTMNGLTRHQYKDIKIIARFTQVWCAGHQHSSRQPYPLPGGLHPVELCEECSRFVAYAIARRLHCPLEAEKPSCKNCRIHCYAPAQRELVKRIMAWSGRRMILRGRLDYLWHYLF
ncbi:nitrous oxide-stimulated promoter family protein [Trichlorobacter ammonificans]|uniref:Nitrous oxide-stimulated promoter n=1 Tax=Trichlorobacter ammonificans TaxID=2916410 RepID=A0ABM9D573_9BACT|nr:nitrous oxide-stimulated promoter family protein [Trichlorobacter ammonificans]CAH2030361.1 Nitrous oxide-stimulated promoter [Trichlorobacter ammonificans]